MKTLFWLMLLPGLAFAVENRDPVECASVLEASLSEDFVAQEVRKLLSFSHPIQTQDLMIKVKSFEAMLYLIHWSGGFRYPTNAFAYFPKQEADKDQFPLQNKLTFSIEGFLGRPEFDDQFVHYIPVKSQKFRNQRSEIRDFFEQMHREFVKATAEGVWPLLRIQMRERLASEMLDGFFSVIPFSQNSLLVHTPIPKAVELEIRQVMSPEVSEYLRRLKESLEIPAVRARVLAEIDKVYPTLLKRRNDFRIFLWNHDTQINGGVLAVSRRKRPEEDLLRLASYLMRESPLLEFASLKQTRAARPLPPSTPAPPDYSRARAFVRQVANSLSSINTEGAEEFVLFFDREMPAYLSSLGVRSRWSSQDLHSLAQVRDARAGVFAEQSRLETLIELLELNDLILAKVLTLLRANAEDLPDSALSHARLNLSLRRLTLLRLEELRPSLNLMRTAAEARYGLNLTQLQSLHEREKILLDGIVIQASEK